MISIEQMDYNILLQLQHGLKYKFSKMVWDYAYFSLSSQNKQNIIYCWNYNIDLNIIYCWNYNIDLITCFVVQFEPKPHLFDPICFSTVW